MRKTSVYVYAFPYFFLLLVASKSTLTLDISLSRSIPFDTLIFLSMHYNNHHQVERGSYTHGLDHEPSSGYSASGATIATYMLPASSAGGGSGGHYAPHKPRDATLDLINQMKQQHAQVR